MNGAMYTILQLTKPLLITPRVCVSLSCFCMKVSCRVQRKRQIIYKNPKRWDIFLSDSSSADGQTGKPAVRQASRDTTEDKKQTDPLTQTEEQRERKTKRRHTERQIKGFSH